MGFLNSWRWVCLFCGNSGDGSVYSWGRGTFGRLGTGKDSDELYPVRVEFDSSKKVGVPANTNGRERPKFVGIAAGAYHSLALEGQGFGFSLLRISGSVWMEKKNCPRFNFCTADSFLLLGIQTALLIFLRSF